MQSKEKDNSLAIGFALLGFAAIAFIAIIGLFVAVLSVVCIFAWNKPVRFMGETVTPDEARGFVMCGVIGATVGLIAGNGASVAHDSRPYFPFVGYMIGSIGFAFHTHLENKADQSTEAEVLPPLNPSAGKNPQQSERQFEFASWDDEVRH